MKDRSLRSRSAFTLIEILVVVSIVGILAALITATASNVSRSGQMAKSVSNLRTIGAGVALYASENGSRLPVWKDDSPGGTGLWWETLLPYTGENIEVFHSPADTNFDATNRESLFETVSYGWNYQVVGRNPEERPPDEEPSQPNYYRKRLSFFTHTSDTLVACEGAAQWCYSYVTAEHPPARDRYDGKTPSLFLDGHVKVLDREVLTKSDPYFLDDDLRH